MAQPGRELEFTAGPGLLGPTHLVSHHASGPRTKTSTLGKPCLRPGKMLPGLLLLSTLAGLTNPLAKGTVHKAQGPPAVVPEGRGAPPCALREGSHGCVRCLQQKHLFLRLLRALSEFPLELRAPSIC